MARRVDLSNNQTIRESIQRIALHGIVNPATGAVKDSARITGYVVKVHTEGDLAGTVDVQEYSSFATATDESIKVGLHEGVYLSAIQDNSKGMVIIPKLYSEVTVTADPDTRTEYVSMFSHVDIIQMDSYEKAVIGVTEREEYVPDDEDAPDVEELEATGVFSRTTYLKDSVVSEVQGEADGDRVQQDIRDKEYSVAVGKDKSSLLVDQEKIQLKHNKATAVLGEDSAVIKHDSSSVTVKSNTVYLGSESGVDDAVLGGELADILCDIVGYIGQIQTTTQLGPQPPLNMAQFIALKAKIAGFKSSHSGFLTKKVQVQK
jgi:hypothetical protein